MPATKLAKRILPTPASLEKVPGLRWLGEYLLQRPWLWVAHRRRVALGAAVGVAVGVLPLPTQMVMACFVAILVRGNVAAAVASTWLTNPFTLVPIWALAIGLGKLVLPSAHAPLAAVAPLALHWSQPSTWWPTVSEWAMSLGKPLLVGLPLAGLVLGAITYLAVYLGWWAVIKMERQRRLAGRARRGSS